MAAQPSARGAARLPGRPGANRSAIVREKLRERIASGEWQLHTRIPGETSLAAEYGVGRGTVREAIGALAELGMVETAAGRGTFVRSRVPTDAVLTPIFNERGPEECLQLRAAIEGEAARTLAKQFAIGFDEELLGRIHPAHYGSVNRPSIPGEFHTRLVEAGCMPLSVSLYATLLTRINAFLSTGKLRHALEKDQRRLDHLEILAAIEAGDASLAANLTAEHALTDLEVV